MNGFPWRPDLGHDPSVSARPPQRGAWGQWGRVPEAGRRDTGKDASGRGPGELGARGQSGAAQEGGGRGDAWGQLRGQLRGHVETSRRAERMPAGAVVLEGSRG